MIGELVARGALMAGEHRPASNTIPSPGFRARQTEDDKMLLLGSYLRVVYRGDINAQASCLISSPLVYHRQ